VLGGSGASARIGLGPDGRAASAALREVGTPYVFGGASPAGFDSSGLVVWAFGQQGVRLPHFSGALFNVGKHVPRSGLAPGDLVFFYGASHVGIYIGHGEFVHAPATGRTVAVARLAGIYSRDYSGAVRIAPTR
jgi:cell wall-associated NlpC family hydrolase